MCRTRGLGDAAERTVSFVGDRGDAGWNMGTAGTGEPALGVEPGIGVFVGSAMADSKIEYDGDELRGEGGGNERGRGEKDELQEFACQN